MGVFSEDITNIPEPNQWSTLLPTLAKLPRKLRVAMPCVGIDGCGAALDNMHVEFEACNVFDLEERYEDYLKEHFEAGGYETIAVGKKTGDLARVKLADLDRGVDLLCAGPRARRGRATETRKQRKTSGEQ